MAQNSPAATAIDGRDGDRGNGYHRGPAPSPDGPTHPTQADTAPTQGNPDSAHALAERAIAVDPWMEAAHRLIVAAHRAHGDDLAARRALARYRDAIHEIG